MEAAAEAGVDSIEHGAYADGDTLAAMKEMKVVWCPTLSTVGNLRGKGRFDEGAVREILETARTAVGEFAAMGGLIAPGTDAGAWAVPHGCLSEYELLEEIPGVTGQMLELGAEEIMRRF
jgi:imidazolonepropionase-like amidohydrolase